MKFAKKSISLLLSIILIISAFAIVPMAASADTATIGVFFTDSQSWDGAGVINVYAWNDDGDLTGSWPGTGMTYLYENNMNQSVYGAKIPATATKVIFNCGGNQTGNIESGVADGAWWYSDNNTAVALSNTYVAGQAATCTEAGVAAHYDLDDNVYDVNLTATTEDAVVIPAAGHTLSHVDAVDATPTTDGNVEYWHCTVCEKNFSDAEGTTEIADVVIPASGVATINGTPYTSLAAAVAAAEDGDTIKVIADCDAAYISVKGKAITINTASKVTITGTQMSGMNVPMFKVASTGSLTFTGSGTITNENDSVVNNNGYVKVSGTTLNGNVAAIYNGGTVEVTSGKVIGIQSAILNASQTATATISGGTVNGGLKLGDPDATFVVNGGTFDAQVDPAFVNTNVEILLTNGSYKYANFNATIFSSDGTYVLLDDISINARLAPGIFASNVTLDLNGHTLTSTATDYAFLLTRNGSASSPKTFVFTGEGTINCAADVAIGGKYNNVTVGEDVVINGGGIAMTGENENLIVNGTINTTVGSFAVSTNGSTTKNGTITINDGAVITSDFVGLFLPGDCVNTIGKATIIAGTGIFTKSGTTTIDGAYVEGNSEAAPYVHSGNGVEASTGNAIVVESCGYPAGAPVISIVGGTFVSENAAPVASYQYGNNAAVKFFITGGEYSAILDEDLIADGYFCEVVKNVDGYYNVVPDTCTAHNFVYFADDKAVACTICGKGYTGLWDVTDEDTYYFEKGLICKDKGLIEIDGDYYYVVYNGKIKKDADRTVTEEKSNGLVPEGLYHFGPDGKMTNPPVTGPTIDENGYYREDGVIVKDKGIVEINDELYFVTYSGKIKIDADRTVVEEKTNGYVPAGLYHFDEEGKMTNRPVAGPSIGDDDYYREDGVIVKDKGVVKFGDDYYFVLYNGKIKKNANRTVTEEKANGLVAPGIYFFDVDGKMVNPIIIE